jgi:hypothetical protein
LEWPPRGAKGTRIKGLGVFSGVILLHRRGETFVQRQSGKITIVFAPFEFFCGKSTAVF